MGEALPPRHYHQVPSESNTIFLCYDTVKAKNKAFHVCSTPNTHLSFFGVQSSTEERIREICHQIVSCKDDDDLIALCAELRTLLGRQIDQLRRRLADYPTTKERRSQSEEDN